MRRWRHTLWLVTIWVLMWGEISVANVLSGLLVAVVLGILSPSAPSAGRLAFHPLAIAHLAGHFALTLVRSNLALVLHVLRRPSQLDPGVIVVPLEGATDGLLTMVANLMALTPGTMPVQVTADPPEIHLHLVHMANEAVVREEARILQRLGISAFGHRAAGSMSEVPEGEVPEAQWQVPGAPEHEEQA